MDLFFHEGFLFIVYASSSFPVCGIECHYAWTEHLVEFFKFGCEPGVLVEPVCLIGNSYVDFV